MTVRAPAMLGPDGSIVSVDRDAEALAIQAHLMAMRFPRVSVRYMRSAVSNVGEASPRGPSRS